MKRSVGGVLWLLGDVLSRVSLFNFTLYVYVYVYMRV
jgi:hypothetical protein